MAGRVQNKVALVTGGASGVGRATVQLLLEEGAFVGISDINAEAGQALAQECGERAVFVRHDVTSEADWSAAIAAVQQRFGPPDILINNAGILIPAASKPPRWRSFASSCRSTPTRASSAASRA